MVQTTLQYNLRNFYKFFKKWMKLFGSLESLYLTRYIPLFDKSYGENFSLIDTLLNFVRKNFLSEWSYRTDWCLYFSPCLFYFRQVLYCNRTPIRHFIKCFWIFDVWNYLWIYMNYFLKNKFLKDSNYLANSMRQKSIWYKNWFKYEPTNGIHCISFLSQMLFLKTVQFNKI